MEFHLAADQQVRVHSLASGSSGNAMLIQAGDTNVLIDAGVPLKRLAASLSSRGVGAGNLHAILLTHEHTDHIIGAGPISRRTGAPIIANHRTLTEFKLREELPFNSREMKTGDEIGIGPIGIRSYPVSHDAVEAVGFAFTIGRRRISYFTDSGIATPAIEEAMAEAELAIVESNHDIEWLRIGPYTPIMKKRVSSATGHLSNADCAEMLVRRIECYGPLLVWLAHLSRVNNSPSLARRSVQEIISARSKTPISLEVAMRDHPSLTWKSGSRSVQLNLF